MTLDFTDLIQENWIHCLVPVMVTIISLYCCIRGREGGRDREGGGGGGGREKEVYREGGD